MTASEMGKKGGTRRSKLLSAERRIEIARMGGKARQQKRRQAVDELAAPMSTAERKVWLEGSWDTKRQQKRREAKA